jgi:hypothetical protein
MKKLVLFYQPATQDAPVDAPAQNTTETKQEDAKETPTKGPGFISKVISSIKERVRPSKPKEVGYVFSFSRFFVYSFY